MIKCFVLAMFAVAFLGCDTGMSGERFPVELRLAEFEPGPGLTERTVQGSDKVIYVRDEAVVTSAHVRAAKATESAGEPAVLLALTDEGADILAEVSEQNIGKPMVIIVGGEVVSAPIIQSRVTGGVRITGSFTLAEGSELAEKIMGE